MKDFLWDSLFRLVRKGGGGELKFKSFLFSISTILLLLVAYGRKYRQIVLELQSHGGHGAMLFISHRQPCLPFRWHNFHVYSPTGNLILGGSVDPFCFFHWFYRWPSGELLYLLFWGIWCLFFQNKGDRTSLEAK